MYLEHFQLKEMPFSLTPDTQFYFDRHSHQAALNTILIALRTTEGFIKVVGEVGTGKTILCRKLLNTLDDQYVTAFLPNPYLTPEEFKGMLAAEIGVRIPKTGLSPYKLLGAIYRRLISLAKKSKQVVLIIDEAQAMPRETIEALRLLTNLETEKHKLLQVVLFGQPELDRLLARNDLRQLKQRIVFSEYLQPLDRRGLRAYVNCRLHAAGNADERLFSGSALRLLFAGSGGIPRLVNILCHKALLIAYGQGSEQIRRRHMARAIRDTEECTRWGRWLAQPARWLWPTALAGTSAAVLLTAPHWLGGGL